MTICPCCGREMEQRGFVTAKERDRSIRAYARKLPDDRHLIGKVLRWLKVYHGKNEGYIKTDLKYHQIRKILEQK